MLREIEIRSRKFKFFKVSINQLRLAIKRANAADLKLTFENFRIFQTLIVNKERF